MHCNIKHLFLPVSLFNLGFFYTSFVVGRKVLEVLPTGQLLMHTHAAVSSIYPPVCHGKQSQALAMLAAPMAPGLHCGHYKVVPI